MWRTRARILLVWQRRDADDEERERQVAARRGDTGFPPFDDGDYLFLIFFSCDKLDK